MMLALVVSGLVSGQEPAGQQRPDPDRAPDAAVSPAPGSARSGPQSPQWRGLSVKEKLKYDWRHVFDLDNMVFAGIGAGFDQLRDRPGEWGQGWGPFAERYASHIGSYVVQRSVMFPVEAMDHEDT